MASEKSYQKSWDSNTTGVEEESSCAEQREYHKQRQGCMESTECVEGKSKCTDGLELGAQHHPHNTRLVLAVGKLRTAGACSRLARAGLGREGRLNWGRGEVRRGQGC